MTVNCIPAYLGQTAAAMQDARNACGDSPALAAAFGHVDVALGLLANCIRELDDRVPFVLPQPLAAA